MKNSGIQVVYTKATEGTYYTDPFLKPNYSNAKAEGLYVGFYHYFKPESIDSSTKQAQYFASRISGLNPECKLVLDLEISGGFSSTELSNLAETFLVELKKLTGIDVAIYTYSNFARYNLTNILSKYPLWIAEYGVNTPMDNPIWTSWIGFQYSDSGYVPGVSGNVDLNVFTNDILLNTSITSPIIPAPNSPEISDNEIFYVVQPGNTLSQIASKYDTTVENLVNINNISNPNLIYPGEILNIPSSISSNTGNSNNLAQSYIVQSGDTLSKIAQIFDTTYEHLAEINNISNPNLIYPGQVLKIY